MLANQEEFTRVVNFRRLAQYLRGKGIREVPDTESLRKEAEEAECRLALWVIDTMRRDPDDFLDEVRFYMNS